MRSDPFVPEHIDQIKPVMNNKKYKGAILFNDGEKYS